MTVSILGLNAFHGDAAAALIIDGQLVAAAEEERFTRVKHWAGFPTEAIRWCLRSAGIRPQALTAIAINSDPRAALGHKLLYTLRHRLSWRLIARRMQNQAARLSLRSQLSEALDGPVSAPVIRVEHHLAHLASAFYCSSFERAAVVSVDGFGDFASGAWALGDGLGLRIGDRLHFPHSLGAFYQALTQYLGFPNYGDEYKVMGLAPYGEDRFAAEMAEIVRLVERGRYQLGLEFFRHHREDVPYQWDGGPPVVGTLFAPALERLLGPARLRDQPLEQRHKDLAHSVQVRYEDAFFHLLKHVQAQSGADCVAIAGGCGANSVANGKVRRRTAFRRVYVQAAAGDAGGAIGAAAVESVRRGCGRPRMAHAYLGPQFDQGQINSALAAARSELAEQGLEPRTVDEDALLSLVAGELAAGRVIGWFQGSMEWGPRALGNRSILGDPRRADMKDILNLKIKRRESFRPFAPSVLAEHVEEWFEESDEVPFMMQVFQIRAAKRALIPAVTHVDGSGRLQTVSIETNPRYWRLIERFRQLTNVPMVLNTSFNENEPVVCTPTEALACFLRTRMDVLALGTTVLMRSAG